jgi:hypothetical protein
MDWFFLKLALVLTLISVFIIFLVWRWARGVSKENDLRRERERAEDDMARKEDAAQDLVDNKIRWAMEKVLCKSLLATVNAKNGNVVFSPMALPSDERWSRLHPAASARPRSPGLATGAPPCDMPASALALARARSSTPCP